MAGVCCWQNQPTDTSLPMWADNKSMPIDGTSRYKQVESGKNISHLTRVNSTSNSSKTTVPGKIINGLKLRHEDDAIRNTAYSMTIFLCLSPSLTSQLSYIRSDRHITHRKMLMINVLSRT